MKKLKRFLAGVLTFAMAMSLMTMTAFADQTTSVATIDESKNGSATLTIHKYAYDGTGSKGTGSESDNVPDDAEELAGAGFTIYKVVDMDGLDTYYGTNPTALPNVSTYAENGAVKAAYASTRVGDEKVTNSTGVVTFTGLELGIYLVVETTKPDAVSTAMSPFLVSIPMTTVDGESWLYDVHVFPKNQTTYGTVILEKTDYDTAATKLDGVTFVLQKLDVNDTDNDSKTDDWITITKEAGAAGDNTGDDLNLTTGTVDGNSGRIKVENLSQGTYRFIETSVGDANKGYIMDGKTVYTFTVNSDGTISYDNSTNGNVVITAKNDKPDFKKEVQDRSDSSWGQDSDYNVGDSIPYKITIDVPANITDLKTFKVTDTPTNLTDDVGTIALTCDGADVATTAYSKAAVGDGFVITFVPAQMAAYAGKQIIVTYKATLKDSAVITTTGNPNTAKLEYSNNIIPTNDPDNPNTDEDEGKDVITDTAVIYTFKINILKKAESESGSALAGVEFDLYKELPDATGAIAADAAKAAGLDTTKYWKKINSSSLVTDGNGTVSYTGLANGDYYLVETKTVAEYNLLKAPVKVTLAVDYTTKMTQSWSWKLVNDVKTLVKHEIESQTFTGTDDTTAATGIEIQTIVNKKGFTLPTTGGVGTYVFVFVGVSMMAAAVILFFMTKKKETSK